MFSAALSSGQAGGSGTSVRLLGSLSLPVVCQPALSRMISACAPGATARPISSMCFLHGFGVDVRHDQRNAGIAARTHRAEQIGVFIALVLAPANAEQLKPWPGRL